MDLNEFFRSLTLSVIITDFMTHVFHSKCTLCPILFRAATANQENLKAYQVVPQLFKKFPPHEVKVEYEHGRKVDFGTIFSEDEIDNPPNKISWTVERKYERAKARFALGMFGPDIPAREIAIGTYQWQHWLIIDIPGDKWKDGRVVTEYKAHEPFYINDLHRVFFIVYRQKGKDSHLLYTDPYVSVHASDNLRGNFHWENLSRKYDLGDPYAINFLQLNSSSEPIMGYKIPPYEELAKNEHIRRHMPNSHIP